MVAMQLVQMCADSGTNILLRFADGSQARSSVSTSMQLAGSALISRLKGALRLAASR